MIDLPKSFEIDGHEYIKNSSGGISQINPDIMEYDKNYINHYRSFDTSGTNRLNTIKMEFILKHADSFVESVLDYGYGTGTFLDRWCQSGAAYGYDIVQTFHQSEVGWRIVKDPFAYDVDCVTLWDVLEHLPDPTIIKNFQTKFLAVSLPNCLAETVEDFANWKHLKPNEHLHHFDLESLKSFMASCGYLMLTANYDQDEIRLPAEDSYNPNILQGLFKKVS